MGDQSADDFGSVLGVVGDDVEHALRQPGFAHHLSDQEVSPRAQFRRLEDHRVAACQGVSDRPRRQDHRPVPRRDAEDHPDRLTDGHRERARLVGRDRLALDLGSQRRCLAQDSRRQVDVEAGPALRRADLARHDGSEVRRPCLHHVGRFEQQAPPLQRPGRRPGRERSGRGVHRLHRIADSRRRRPRRHLVGHWIAPLESGAAGRGDFSVVDEQLGIHACLLPCLSFPGRRCAASAQSLRL